MSANIALAKESHMAISETRGKQIRTPSWRQELQSHMAKSMDGEKEEELGHFCNLP